MMSKLDNIRTWNDYTEVIHGSDVSDALFGVATSELGIKRECCLSSLKKVLENLKRLDSGSIHLMDTHDRTAIRIDYSKLGKTNRWRYSISATAVFTLYDVREIRIEGCLKVFHEELSPLYLFPNRKDKAYYLWLTRLESKSGMQLDTILNGKGKYGKLGKYFVATTAKGTHFLFHTAHGILAFKFADRNPIDQIKASLAILIAGDTVDKILKSGEWPDELIARALEERI